MNSARFEVLIGHAERGILPSLEICRNRLVEEQRGNNIVGNAGKPRSGDTIVNSRPLPFDQILIPLVSAWDKSRRLCNAPRFNGTKSDRCPSSLNRRSSDHRTTSIALFAVREQVALWDDLASGTIRVFVDVVHHRIHLGDD